jgi:hypothetical protein
METKTNSCGYAAQVVADHLLPTSLYARALSATPAQERRHDDNPIPVAVAVTHVQPTLQIRGHNLHK